MEIRSRWAERALALTATLAIAAPTLEAKSVNEKAHFLDHFVIGIHDLEVGSGMIEELTGVKPVYGGAHPHIGTHNALISLGEQTYLEILAPNPGADMSGLDPAMKAKFMDPLYEMKTLTLDCPKGRVTL